MNFANIRSFKGNYFKGFITEGGKDAEIHLHSKLWFVDTTKIDDAISELQALKTAMVETKVYKYPVYYNLASGSMELPSFGVAKNVEGPITENQIYYFAKQLLLDSVVKYQKLGIELPDVAVLRDSRYKCVNVTVNETDMARFLFDISIETTGGEK